MHEDKPHQLQTSPAHFDLSLSLELTRTSSPHLYPDFHIMKNQCHKLLPSCSTHSGSQHLFCSRESRSWLSSSPQLPFLGTPPDLPLLFHLCSNIRSLYIYFSSKFKKLPSIDGAPQKNLIPKITTLFQAGMISHSAPPQVSVHVPLPQHPTTMPPGPASSIPLQAYIP